MSNIHGRHVHSVKTWRNLIWGIVFSANTASVTDAFEIIAQFYLTRKVEEEEEDTAVKLDRSMEGLAGSVVEVVLTEMLVFTLLE